MSTMTIYLCENCRKRSDSDLRICITARNSAGNSESGADWKIFIDGKEKRAAKTFSRDAHLCSAKCLLAWLGLTVEESAPKIEGKP